MAKRREHGEGSIFYDETKSLWVGTVSFGTDPATGKRLRTTVYAKTKPEVVVKMREAKPPESKDATTKVADASQLTKDYLAFWLEAIKAAGCALSTHESYERTCVLHIIPYLGLVPLNTLTAYHGHQLFAALAKDGATAYTQRYAHRVLRSALSYAVFPLKALPANPLFGIKGPSHTTKKFEVWTPEQCETFLASTVDDKYYVAYVLDIDCGIRGGETLGLQWTDIDLAAGTVHIQATLNLYKGRIVGRGKTKTKSSDRVIPLTPRALQALRRQRAKLLERGLAATLWVVPTVRGGPVNRSNFRRVYKTAVLAAGLPYIRPHDMRHTHATILVQNGVGAKDVAERLGHSSVTTTLQTYVHSDLEQQRKVTERFSKIMKGEE